jgi:excisionase family DNA binding protein
MDCSTVRLLSGSEVARQLQISESRVRQLADAGAIPAVRTRLGRLYAADDVATFAQQRQVRAAGEAADATP